MLTNTHASVRGLGASIESQMPADPGSAYTSEYHSNDIIAVIEDLRERFIKVKADFDNKEFESNSMFEKKRLPSGESGFVGRVLEALP